MKQLVRRPIFDPPSSEEAATIPDAARIPTWHCFCCGDTGFIQPLLVRKVIPDYNSQADAIPVCRRCPQGNLKLYGETEDTLGYKTGTYDDRFPRSLCDELDSLNRDNWLDWQDKRLELVAKTQGLVNNFVQNFGQSDEPFI